MPYQNVITIPSIIPGAMTAVLWHADLWGRVREPDSTRGPFSGALAAFCQSRRLSEVASTAHCAIPGEEVDVMGQRVIWADRRGYLGAAGGIQ